MTPTIRTGGEGGWIDQTTFYDPADPAKGNCTEAAVASLLGFELGEVPGFWQLDGDASDFWDAFYSFLSTCGFHVVMLPGNHTPDCNYLASGPSARGCSHMVVMRSGHLLHDPHPSRAGLLSINHVWLVVHRDPRLVMRALAA